MGTATKGGRSGAKSLKEENISALVSHTSQPSAFLCFTLFLASGNHTESNQIQVNKGESNQIKVRGGAPSAAAIVLSHSESRASCPVVPDRSTPFRTTVDPDLPVLRSFCEKGPVLRSFSEGGRTKITEIPVAITRFFDSLLGLSGSAGKGNGPWPPSCEGGSSSVANAAKEETTKTLKSIPCSAGCRW